MKYTLIVAAVAEMATGLALLVAPSLVGQLLVGTPLVAPASAVGGVLGLALMGLGIACWPGPSKLGMLFYSASVTLYLAWAGLLQAMTGPLLWPVVALHAALSVLLALACDRAWPSRS